MKFIAVTIIGLLLFSSVVIAQQDISSIIDGSIKTLPGTMLPDKVSSLVGNEVIVGHVGDLEVSGVTNNNVISSIEYGSDDEVTLHLYASEETVKDILNSDNTLDAFQTALKEKKITHKGVGIGKKIKFGVLMTLARWFG